MAIDMTTSSFRALLAENEQVLAGIEARGADLSKKVEIEFLEEFNQKDSAKQARAELRKLGGLPDDGCYMIADYSKSGGRYHLLICVPMVPDAQVISELEARLCYVADVFGGEPGGWEFADVDN